MIFADLTDTSINFYCDDNDSTAEYMLSAHNRDELLHYRELDSKELAQLRRNCKSLLEATERLSTDGEL